VLCERPLASHRQQPEKNKQIVGLSHTLIHVLETPLVCTV